MGLPNSRCTRRHQGPLARAPRARWYGDSRVPQVSGRALGVCSIEVDELRFEGAVKAGIGRHSELIVPGRGVLRDAPHDWPESLCPGSLNIRVDHYPAVLDQRGLSNRIAELDRSLFRPEFEIPRDLLGNNQLRPRSGVPRGGDAQVWRARLTTLDGSLTLRCWALRRFGSRVGEQLEFVAAEKLRAQGLEEAQRVEACLFGRWHDA
jgi:hypothetical protein